VTGSGQAGYRLPMPTSATRNGSPIPVLLRASRAAYGDAIHDRLAAEGYGDVSSNGAYVLGGIWDAPGSAADIIRELRVSKQVASQLIDTLVVRGYLERAAHPDDRRRLTIILTERGRTAAELIRSCVDDVDAELERRTTPDDLAAFRRGLETLAAIRDGGAHAHDDRST
jgi:DNA-binding MarR family transcriptional regulator